MCVFTLFSFLLNASDWTDTGSEKHTQNTNKTAPLPLLYCELVPHRNRNQICSKQRTYQKICISTIQLEQMFSAACLFLFPTCNSNC